MKKVKDFFKDCLEEIGRGILHEYGYKIEKGSDKLPETFSYLRSIFYYFGGILYIPVPNIESITIITLILFAEKKE